MTNIYESHNYDVSFRSILDSDNSLKVFTNNDFIKVDSEIEFDINNSHKTSLNYFASSIVGGIVQSLIARSKKNNIIIEELEAKISLTLKHPLSLLGVRGYDDKPNISSCTVTIYLYADVDSDELITFCQKSLDYCFIYNTIKNSIDININFIEII